MASNNSHEWLLHRSYDKTKMLDLPVIMTDDATTSSNGSHDMHQMDHDGHSMNHDMDGMDGMDHMDHSTHSMSGMSMGTIMYMDGFHSALFSSSETPPPCLNLFNPNWTLDSKEKFIMAMIFITILGVLVEGCGVWRVKCLRRGRYIRRRERQRRVQTLQNQSQQQLSDNVSQAEASHSNRAPVIYPVFCLRVWRTLVPRFIRNATSKFFGTKDASKQIKQFEILAASLHAMRAWLGYLLMLAVMSYAVEFLFCAIVGMALGRYWFIENEVASICAVGTAAEIMDSNDNFQGGDDMWGGGDPCCGIDDDDEDFSVNNNIVASEVETPLMQNEQVDESNMNEPLLGSSLSRRNVA